MTKKNELSESKIKTQIEVMLPVDMRDHAFKALEHCKTVRKYYR